MRYYRRLIDELLNQSAVQAGQDRIECLSPQQPQGYLAIEIDLLFGDGKRDFVFLAEQDIKTQAMFRDLRL